MIEKYGLLGFCVAHFPALSRLFSLQLLTPLSLSKKYMPRVSVQLCRFNLTLPADPTKIKESHSFRSATSNFSSPSVSANYCNVRYTRPEIEPWSPELVAKTLPTTQRAGNTHTHTRTYIYIYIYIYTNPSSRAGYDTRSIFKQSLTGLNSEFSFS